MKLIDPSRQRLFPMPARFIACRKEHKRRMVPECSYHAFGFSIKHLLHRRARIYDVPHAGFGLQVKAKLVGCYKRSLWRTPRVESHVVQAPLFANAKHSEPRIDIGRRIPRQWEIASVMRST